MSEQAFQDSWWLLTRARGVGLVLRLIVAAGPMVALWCTRLASGERLPAIEIAVVLLTMWCVVVPDSHLGTLVVLLVGIGWLASVDDTTTPWSLAAALSLLVFHTALAASSIAAPAATWTPSMRRRWLRRVGVLAVGCAAVWSVVAAVNVYDVASSSALVAAALVVLALAGIWSRSVTLAARRDPHVGS